MERLTTTTIQKLRLNSRDSCVLVRANLRQVASKARFERRVKRTSLA